MHTIYNCMYSQCTIPKQKLSRFMPLLAEAFCFFSSFCFIFCIYPNHLKIFRVKRVSAKALKDIKIWQNAIQIHWLADWLAGWMRNKRDDWNCWNWTEQYNLNANKRDIIIFSSILNEEMEYIVAFMFSRFQFWLADWCSRYMRVYILYDTNDRICLFLCFIVHTRAI